MNRHLLILAAALAAGALLLLRPDTAPEPPAPAQPPAGETAQGLSRQEVLSALQQHPELIPYEGTLGGTMHFVAEESRVDTERRLVEAVFEDGHRRGQMQLRYRLDGEGRIQWEVQEARLD